MDRRKCGCMKTYQTNAVCPKCGKQLLTTDIPAYAFVCPDCDENFYGIEIMDYFGDEFEISAECTKDVFSENLDKLKNLLPDHLMNFIGYDEEVHMVDFGFSRILSNNEVLPFVNALESILNPKMVNKKTDLVQRKE